MPKAEAERHYKEYLETIKTRKEKYLEDLKQVYYHLSKGHKVLAAWPSLLFDSPKGKYDQSNLS
jgi:hypothetical protein